MYLNLEVEILKHKIKKEEIAKVIDKTLNTLRQKMMGTSNFTYDEAVKIQETFFENYDLKELFKNE